jgi:hypothetical protein
VRDVAASFLRTASLYCAGSSDALNFLDGGLASMVGGLLRGLKTVSVMDLEAKRLDHVNEVTLVRCMQTGWKLPIVTHR